MWGVCVSKKVMWVRERKKETCFSAFTAETLLAVSLPHVDISAAGLGESLPTDPTVVRLLPWDTHRNILSCNPFWLKRLFFLGTWSYTICAYVQSLQRSAQLCSCKLCPTHQNVQACVSVDWNTLRRIARNHLLHTGRASLLEGATHIYILFNSTTNRLNIVNSLFNAEMHWKYQKWMHARKWWFQKPQNSLEVLNTAIFVYSFVFVYSWPIIMHRSVKKVIQFNGVDIITHRKLSFQIYEQNINTKYCDLLTGPKIEEADCGTGHQKS